MDRNKTAEIKIVMENESKLPDWLCQNLRIAFLGEIYWNIRAIAVKYSADEICLRYYLDRKPTKFDYESINVVAANLEAGMPKKLKKLDVECVFFDGPGNQMNPLDGIFYAKREYEMQSVSEPD